MAFKRWGCEFDGPWPNTDLLLPRPGIWVVWHKNGSQWTVLEVGESADVRASVLRSAQKLRAGTFSGHLHYSASYSGSLLPEARRELVARVRRVAQPRG